MNRIKRAKSIAFNQAREMGLTPQQASQVADSVGRQIALTQQLADNPDDASLKIELEFHRNFVRLVVVEDEKVWYARAAASVAATEYAISIGYVPKNWLTSMRNAGIIAEANCEGTDREAQEAFDAAKAAMGRRLEEAAQNGAVKA